MNDQSSNSTVPQKPKNQANWNENVYDTYTTQITRLGHSQGDEENTEITSKDTQYKVTHNETAAEDEYETTAEGETVTEEEDETTEEEGEEGEGEEGEEKEEAIIEITIPEEVTVQKKEKRNEKRVQINEGTVLISRDDIETSEIDLVIKGDDIVVEEEAKLKPKSSPSFKTIKGKLVSIVGQDHSLGLVQEPWPKDVKLYQPYEVEQILLPDNANCLAVQAFLRMCNLDFEIVARANAEFMSPSGKVPFIRCGAFIVSELEGIVQFVNNKGISLTTNMESEQKSDMRAYMSLVHNVLENAELYLCWCDKETYNEVTKPRNGSVYPWPLNYIQTWSKKSAVCKRLKMMGWYNKSLEDVYQEVENCCQALTDRLEGKEYFFGKKCTEMDAIVYGHIYSILTISIPADNNRLAYIVQQYEKLTDHCRKIHKQVMKQDHIFVVTKSSRIIDTGNETETENNLPTDSEELLEGEDYEDIDSGSSFNLNAGPDQLYSDL